MHLKFACRPKKQILYPLFDERDLFIHPEDLAKIFKNLKIDQDVADAFKEVNLRDRVLEVIMVLKNNLYLSRQDDNPSPYPFDVLGYKRKKTQKTYYDLILPTGNTIGKFFPTLTDSGICFAHNAANFSSAYKIQTGSHVDSIREMFRLDEDGPAVKRITGSGKNLERSVWLEVVSSSSSVDSSSAVFPMASVNNWLDFFSVSPSWFEIRPGFETVIYVQPVVHSVSENLRTLPEHKRKCRFAEETRNESEMFLYYTQRSCIFECSLRNAIEKAIRITRITVQFWEENLFFEISGQLYPMGLS